MVVKDYPDGSSYDGDMEDGRRHGQGTLTYSDGGLYEGEWRNDMRHGHGTNTWSNGQEYVGHWKCNVRHGQGTLTFPDGGRYVGEWAKGVREGQGENFWPNGCRYVGNWRRNKRHGQGTFNYADGGTYTGQWSDDHREGKGQNRWKTGERYDGEWKGNQQHGQGVWYNTDGTGIDGTWDSGKRIMPVPGVVSSMCPTKQLALEFLKSLNWPRSIFNNRNDRCYCTDCYSPSWKQVISVGGHNYVIPKGFVRFGLQVDTVFTEHHKVWSDWVVTFHGTTKIGALSIIQNRQFCLPGDRLIDDTILGIRDGHIPDQKFIFTSPTIAYSSSRIYSQSYPFYSKTRQQQHTGQIVLQCRQKPGSYKVQRETIGLNDKRICEHIDNDKMEYFTDIRASLVAYGLLIRVR
jgi:hypothetical protein